HKTGELVRYNADGSLTSVGSKDEHIQILSHRAEVEARLLERIKGYESVAVEVVVPLKGVKKPTVMAFLVEKETPQSNGTNGHSSTLANGHQKNGTTNGTTKPGPVVNGIHPLPPSDRLQFDLAEIRASLADAIPSYMTPTVYVPLARMPRTSKGEVDRQRLRDIAKSIDERQLAAYGDTGASSRVTKLKPSTDLEKHLQSLWSRILGVEGILIGASDSFFQLGGDSVAAMKLVALARREQVVTTVASIFEHPILGDLAVVIEQEEAARIGGANSEIAADEETIAPLALWDEVDDMSVESRSERVAQVAAQCQILAEQIEDIYPCTPLQEGMMAITMRQPRAYIGRVAFRILETVDVARFKAAWDRLVAENPILRTRIVPGPSAGPQSLQVVVKEGVQWRTSTSVDAYRLEDDRTTMSLGGPLARYGMVESRSSGRDKAVFFVWTVHHALFDGWSRQTLLSQLQHLYMHDELAAPVVPYNRFMRYLSRSPFEEAEAFWKDQLQGNVPRSYPALPSPAYLPRPNVKIQAFVRMDMNNAKIGGWDMPLSVMLRAAWAVVMATYSGSDDVIFASTLSGRSAPVAGISDITGPTMTTVPIRITIDRQGSALDFVRAVNEQATRMIAFEQTGLQNIRRLVGKADDGLGLGLTTNFLVQPPEAESQESALMVSERDGAATLDFESYLLILECCVESTGVTLKVQYDDNVLNVKRVESYLSQYQHVLAQLITSAGQQQTEPVVPVGSLFSASPRDMERLLEWNKEVPPALEECIHQIVQNQADLQPDAPAICSRDRNLTYRELDELAAKLASQLVDLGVAAEVNVPLCLEKSPWAIVAELAVLKAGGVCVPLDPARPAVQNEAILRNVRPVIILASPQHEELFRNSSCNVLPIDDTLQRELQNAQPFRRRVATPGNNAFIIHTSGSTGVPKGVVLQHKALATSCRAHGEAFGLGPQSRVVQFAAYTFDASIQDIFTTLQQGGCVCVISDHERMNNLSAGVNRTQANFANLTSTVAALLRPDHVPTLKTIILAGEPVRPDVVALWGNRRDVRLLNSYGPSECSINSSCSPPIEDAARASNIGGPLANLFWVVDPTDSDRLCPLGAVGELLIEGPILARGYLHDEAKTRSSFIYDPAWIRQYGLGAGRRMFKTGDLVRYNDDRGSLTYIGRKDTQVKIRGQRVEMSEIQHQLHRLVPTAKTVAVELIHHPSHPERHILAAFVALEDTADQDRENGDEAIANGARALSLTDSLRRRFSEVYGALGSVLPHYMVPSVYVPVNKMPENASRKLDRRQLRSMLESMSEIQIASHSLAGGNGVVKVAPSTVMEKRLQSLWARILGMSSPDGIGATDNFFHLGGDSVAAMRLVSLARDDGDVSITVSVAQIFEYPILQDLSREVEGAMETTPEVASVNGVSVPEPFALWAEAPTKRPAHLQEIAAKCGVLADDIEDVYPCTPLQEGLMAVTAFQAKAYVRRSSHIIPDAIETSRLEAAWRSAVRTYAILRTRIVPVGIKDARSLQVVIRNQDCQMRCRTLAEFKQADALDDISHGKALFRYAIVVDEDSGDRHFVWTVHHAVYDGRSFQLLWKQVDELFYHGLQPPVIPFNLYIQYIENSSVEAETAYWRAQFSSAEQRPVTYPSGLHSAYIPRTTMRVAKRTRVAEPATTELSASHATVMRSAWAIAVSNFSGSRDIILAEALSGRTAPVPGIEDMVAPTITTVPLRVRLQPAQRAVDYVADMHRQTVAMMPFEHCGLQRIQAMVDTKLDLGHLFVVQPLSRDEMAAKIPQYQEVTPIEDGVDGFDSYALVVECDIAATGGDVLIEARFDESVLDVEQVSRLVDHFFHVLSNLVGTTGNNKDASVAELGVASQRDVRQIVERQASVDLTRVDTTANGLFEQQAARSPDQLAVDAWDGKLTYHQLDQVSSRLAVRLRLAGVKIGDRVALHFDKSKWAIVSMLATLKAGGVFLQLSPKHPESRIKAVIQNSGACIVLTSENHTSRLGGLVDRVMVPDDSLFAIEREEFSSASLNGNASLSVGSGDAACVIYTSGSTGTPKGVVMEHGALATGVKTLGEAYGIKNNTRVFQFAAYIFDVHLQDIFATLCAGGCLCVASESQLTDSLTHAIRDARVDVIHLTSTVAGVLDPAALPSLRTLILSGELIKGDVITRWAPHVKIITAYGPSECGLNTALNTSVMHARDATNIGHGIKSKLYIVNSNDPDSLAPIGCVGEIVAEGPLLSREYLQDPDMTKARFIENPRWTTQAGLGPAMGRRLFLTGDLGRYNRDGSLTYLGRKDTQVKIHGQRVELGEIEEKVQQLLPPFLSRDKGVAVEVVETTSPLPGHTLAVFFEAEAANLGGILRIEQPILPLPPWLRALLLDLQSLLGEQLPQYMVPAAYVPLQRLPVNTSGKLDRRGLREIARSFTQDEWARYRLIDDVKQLPSNGMQKQLQALWSRILGVEASSIGAGDSFLALGGDSVSAMRLVAACEQEGLLLSVANLLRHPKLRDMAETITAAEAKTEPVGTGSRLPASGNIEPFALWNVQEEARPMRLEELALQCDVSTDQIEDVY
ncbi:hypothetical protein LZ30DRAFT_426916, partial [Colletotrichum cereale]